jgi:hypothetical protein
MCCIVEHGEKSINSLWIVFGKFWAKMFLTVFYEFISSTKFYINCNRTRQNSKNKAGWIAKIKITRKQGKLINERIYIVNGLKSNGKIEMRKNTYSQSIPPNISQITFP